MRSYTEVRIYNPNNLDEYYLLSPDDSKVWIANQDGEGMGMSQAQLFNIIHEWFKATH